mmetsp:Transcript_694/g.886  ORF Transcript_694/g.886 Transcript_694/m.886 type:complete len:86 (+) Transcript_694:3-260(+)
MSGPQVGMIHSLQVQASLPNQTQNLFLQGLKKISLMWSMKQLNKIWDTIVIFTRMQLSKLKVRPRKMKAGAQYVELISYRNENLD